jgi:regulator of protease activity HflC (stomatin/prohibitin superfamily)
VSMADEPDHQDIDYGVEDEPMEVETPRRAASAQLVQESEIGAAAAMREAMDPANQSLAEALRLSYRVLQFVIVALVVLFLVSGFQRVHEGQSGVMLRFGRIVADDGRQALEPGLRRNLLPYPAGEFIIFEVDGRSVDLGETYWPRTTPGVTQEQAIERASVKSTLDPGRAGTVTTVDGDLGHLKLDATYQILDPVGFVRRVRQGEANRVVEMALQRAVIHTTASIPLQELVDQPEATAERIKAGAQEILDRIGCGIQLQSVTLPDAKPPLAIVKTYRELQNARVEAIRTIEKARQEADETLIDAAGANYPQLVAIVESYEQAEDRGDRRRADELLDEINAYLEGDAVSGRMAEIIREAQAYESEIERTLGREAQRFARVLPRYRRQPELEIKRLWMEAIGEVLSRKDAEIIHVPAGLGSVALRIAGLQEISEIRRREMLKRKEQDAQREALQGYQPHQRSSDEWEVGRSVPLLDVGDDERIKPRGGE